MEVEFPAGCQGLVGVRVNDKGWQVLPWSRDEWLVSDDFVPSCDAPYPVMSAPFIFTIYGYNEDTVNGHTVKLRVIMREGVTGEFLNLSQFLDALRGM